MTDNFYDFEEQDAEAQGRDHLFLWTLLILFLVAMAFVCWLGSFYIFGHPEEARPYKVLQKLHKIETPKRFEITAAPRGEFLTPQRLFERFSKSSPLQMHQENADLLRDYIKNYHETKKLVPYATGRFEIIKAYELQKSDFVTSGMAVIAAAADNAQIIIEHIYPASPENVARLRPLLQPGFELKLERTRDLPAVIHVERTTDGRFQFTVLPLSYGEYALKNGVGTFSLEPPSQLNVAAGLPLIRGNMYSEAMQAYADFRRTKPRPAEGDDAAKSQEPQLVRLDTFEPGTKVPETGALPEVPSATPIPLSTPRLAGHAGATPPKLAMNATPHPRTGTLIPMGTPVPVATPIPATVAQANPAPSPSGVPLKPFIASVSDGSVRPNAAGNWRVYAPGQQPLGRSVTSGEADTLADRAALGERLYLRGSFVVTASGDNWAVLRSQEGGAGGKTTPVRVIVEYPGSIAPPPAGSTFSRDESRGFQVEEVSRRADGQINISAREVTQPQ